MSFTVGHFYSSKQDFEDAYVRHCDPMSGYRDIGSINTKQHSVSDRNIEHRYYHVDQDGRWKQRIMGVSFQGVFTSVLNIKDEHYIMSRFRPR